MPIVLLAYYCVFILLASIAGGMLPLWVKMTHRWMEVAVSFVAGVMLGVGLLDLLPHALEELQKNAPAGEALYSLQNAMLWLLAGFLVMFLVERFFSFHQHDAPQDFAAAQDTTAAPPAPHTHCEHGHGLDISWGGAMLGLSIHSVLAGVALAASVAHGSHDGQLAGLGTFLAIVLHKPFDALTIALLMERGGWRPPARHLVNSLFALAIPLGAALFHLGIYGFEPGEPSARSPVLAYALAFSAGTFFCIAMSDLLPELQFHRHDRVKLSLALLLGVAVAYGAQRLESGVHGHTPAPPEQDSQGKTLNWSYPYCLLSPDPVGAGRVRLGGSKPGKSGVFLDFWQLDAIQAVRSPG